MQKPIQKQIQQIKLLLSPDGPLRGKLVAIYTKDPEEITDKSPSTHPTKFSDTRRSYFVLNQTTFNFTQ